MKILYYMPYCNSVGADRWIYECWKEAFLDMGHDFFVLTEEDDFRVRALDIAPDIFMVANLLDICNVKYQEALKTVRKSGAKVLLITSLPLSKEVLAVIKHEDIADIYYGESEHQNYVDEFVRQTGKAYHLIPFAASKVRHYPSTPVEKFQYDIVYLGAYLPKKRGVFQEVLLPLARKYRVGIFGPNWTVKDNLFRATQKLCRLMSFKWGADLISQARLSIPMSEENQLYSSAKICLNFHEREEDGSQPHYVLNQRTFTIPACGGFELCDYVPAIRKYFGDDEVVMAGSRDEWFSKVEYYLENESARKVIQRNGTVRALRDHTYHIRVQQVLSLASGCVQQK